MISFDERVWFIWVEGKQEGLYSGYDLKHDPRVTPDTLVWTQGFETWKPIRFVPDLQKIFEDEPESKPIHEALRPKSKPLPDGLQDREALTMEQDPFQQFLWLIILVFLTFYFFYRYYYGF